MEATKKRLSAERRNRIVDAARHLILKNGLKGTTMEAIAREARIAKPTLYAYFPDKESVFGAIVAALTAELSTAFHAAISAPGCRSRILMSSTPVYPDAPRIATLMASFVIGPSSFVFRMGVSRHTRC